MLHFENISQLVKLPKIKAIIVGWFLFFMPVFTPTLSAQNSARGGNSTDSLNNKNQSDTITIKKSVIIDTNLRKNQSINQEILSKKTVNKLKVDTSQHIHSPKKAAIMSAVLPGTGQIYNKKYWKAPIIYASGGALGYFLTYNNKNYQTYKKAYIYRMDKDPNTIDVFQNYSEDWIKAERDASLKYLEYTYIFTTIWYVLNIVDASVDAHFFYFDVNDNLSMAIEPLVFPNYQFGIKNYGSLKFTLRF